MRSANSTDMSRTMRAASRKKRLKNSARPSSAYIWPKAYCTGWSGEQPDAAKAVEQDQAHADGGDVSELPLGGQREPQIHEEQPQAERQHQQFVTEQQEVHRVSRVTTAFSLTLGWILSVSRRGKQPKTSRHASKQDERRFAPEMRRIGHPAH